MKNITYLVIFSLFMALPMWAQSYKEDDPWSVNESTMFGAGHYNLKDTYLSPLKYTGWGVRILNERMKVVRLADYNISRQQFINVDIGSTTNPAENATNLTAFADYSLGYHYRFCVAQNLKILAGASSRAMLGFIYNTRNGNNPASAKADIDLNISAMAIYGLNIGSKTLTFRYQMEVPFAGVFFSPHMGQSYYEIFNLGNTSGVIQFNSFHNKLAMKNYLTMDLPVGNYTLRFGYLNSMYYTDVNHIESHIVSHSFLFGFVKEFVAFGGKRLKKNNYYRSAFY